jgi:sugar lactone lactonase YvrE
MDERKEISGLSVGYRSVPHFLSDRLMKKKLLRALLVFVALAITGLLWISFGPAPVDPIAYRPPRSEGFVGQFAVNQGLLGAEVIPLQSGVGPEDVAVDAEGRIYGGLDDGRIIRILESGKQETFATIRGGRPLGLHFDGDGNLIVADAWKGLLSISADGAITALATEEGGLPFAFTDDLDIATDGKIYFSDASSKYRQPEYSLDLLEARGHGRLLVYDPATRQTKRLLDGLYFANGVALSTNEDFVLVCETGRYRITRYWIKGQRAGTSDLFIENLPGFPDGVSSNRHGVFWLALPSPRVDSLDRIHPSPMIKRLITMLPLPKPEAIRYGLVVALDEQGNVLGSYHAPEGAAANGLTSVQQSGDQIYMGNLDLPRIVRMKVPQGINPEE